MSLIALGTRRVGGNVGKAVFALLSSTPQVATQRPSRSLEYLVRRK